MYNTKLHEAVGSAYQQHYRKQSGGTTVFRGSRRWQRGDGVGDIIRGIARFLLPVVLRGASTFAGETINANERGVSLGEAAKGALKPAMQAAVEAVAESFQGGIGKQAPVTSEQGAARMKRKSDRSSDTNIESKRRRRKSSKRKSSSGSVKQKGGDRKKVSTKRVYKGNQLGGQASAKTTKTVRKSTKKASAEKTRKVRKPTKKASAEKTRKARKSTKKASAEKTRKARKSTKFSKTIFNF